MPLLDDVFFREVTGGFDSTTAVVTVEGILSTLGVQQSCDLEGVQLPERCIDVKGSERSQMFCYTINRGEEPSTNHMLGLNIVS